MDLTITLINGETITFNKTEWTKWQFVKNGELLHIYYTNRIVMVINTSQLVYILETVEEV